jgi:hypothetical protein
MRDRQWETGQSSPRPEVSPTLTWSWATDCRQSKGIVEVPLPEALQFPRAEEPEPDRFGVGLLQGCPLVGGQGRAPLRRFGYGQCFT